MWMLLASRDAKQLSKITKVAMSALPWFVRILTVTKRSASPSWLRKPSLTTAAWQIVNSNFCPGLSRTLTWASSSSKFAGHASVTTMRQPFVNADHMKLSFCAPRPGQIPESSKKNLSEVLVPNHMQVARAKPRSTFRNNLLAKPVATPGPFIHPTCLAQSSECQIMMPKQS